MTPSKKQEERVPACSSATPLPPVSLPGSHIPHFIGCGGRPSSESMLLTTRPFTPEKSGGHPLLTVVKGCDSDFCADAYQSLDPQQTPSSSHACTRESGWRGPSAWRIDQSGDGRAGDEAHRERQGSAEFRTPHASKGSVDLSGSFRKPRVTAGLPNRARCHSQPLDSRLRGNDGWCRLVVSAQKSESLPR